MALATLNGDATVTSTTVDSSATGGAASDGDGGDATGGDARLSLSASNLTSGNVTISTAATGAPEPPAAAMRPRTSRALQASTWTAARPLC
ncbi:hypothetical protein H9L13_04370 [Sphingomonas lutea]|uniref:Uncharacterized protein n=1 Tax=Sphingomonas lutea TaxID=1045317 RepID=A0A7G9SJV1_9SPHN|nr:hypothetical protein [Sphingomonas lutea]QNN68126.1 hypothetical protein H9L13_04370 [Sphingomonas lutea]